MMSPGTAHAAFRHAPESISAQPAGHGLLAGSGRPSLRDRIRAYPELARLAESRGNHEATSPLSVRFEQLDEGTIAADHPTRFNGGWILPMEKPALIGTLEDDDLKRVVLTAPRGPRNECLILFDEAYRTIRITLVQPPSTSDATITFLRHTTFVPQYRRAYDRAGGGCVERIDTYTSENLAELQGIVWRGMTVGIQRIDLIP
jgi:hypothetical protein